MQTKTKVVLTVVVATLVGFLIQSNAPLGSMLWPPSEDLPVPTGAQLPLFMVYGVIAAIGFGLAVAFLFFGRPLVSRLGLGKGITTAAHLSIVWVLGNWAIHDSLHIANGHDLWGLIGIEFAFHGTLIVAGALLAWTMVRVGRLHNTPAAAPEPVPAPAPVSKA